MSFKNGDIPWNKGKTLSKSHIQKLREAKLKNPVRHWLGKKRIDISCENHKKWKGSKVGCGALHSWMRAHKIKPKFCELCNNDKKLELANKDHKYIRNIKDFMWICRSCHRKWDIKYNGYKKLRITKSFSGRSY